MYIFQRKLFVWKIKERRKEEKSRDKRKMKKIKYCREICSNLKAVQGRKWVKNKIKPKITFYLGEIPQPWRKVFISYTYTLSGLGMDLKIGIRDTNCWRKSNFIRNRRNCYKTIAHIIPYIFIPWDLIKSLISRRRMLLLVSSYLHLCFQLR